MITMPTLGYEIVDVFTEDPFSGNPLAVMMDADHLHTDQLQALAREFNLSETVFVLEPVDPGASYRVRIFSPTTEIPFGGHPSVGVAATLVRSGRLGAGALVQECGAGLIPITVEQSGAATLTGGSPRLGPELDPGPLLAAVGLAADDFAGPAPRIAGCGLDFPYLSVHPDAVPRATCPSPAEVPQISVFSWNADTRIAQARVFVPGLGVPEDPAAGSAALGLGVWLVAANLVDGSGTSRYRVLQGQGMGRPATLDCTVTATNGHAVSATVSGQVTPVASGRIVVPPMSS